MKFLSTIILSFISQFTFGQFAIIQDKEGFCNVRSSTEAGDNIVTQLKSGHVVYSFEKSCNWINIDYSKNGKEYNGYVYQDRIKPVTEFQKIYPISESENSITFWKDSIKIVLTTQRFDKNKYHISYYQENKNFIQFINGKKFWGTDGGLPNTEYHSLKIIIGEKEIELPKAALANLFNPNLYRTEVYIDNGNDIIYIQSLNSDGAGGYLVLWKIENRKYKERYIFNGF